MDTNFSDAEKAIGRKNSIVAGLTTDILREMGVVATGTKMVLTGLYADFGTADGQKAMQNLGMEWIRSMRLGRPRA